MSTDLQPAPWQELLPADATIEQDGKQVPMRDIPFVKEPKDFPTFVKQALDAHKEVGARVRLPGKDAKPEDRAAFLKTITDAGLMTAPPASPTDYAITKPETLPDGIVWNEQAAGKLADVLHKHGAPKGLEKDLIDLQMEMLKGHQASLAVSDEQATAAMKKEFGEQYDSLKESASRLAAKIFSTPEEKEFLDRTGLGNSPGLIRTLMRLAPLAMQDSSFLPTANKEDQSPEDSDAIREEVKKIQDEPGPWTKSKNDRVDKLYRDKYGSGKVQL